MVSSAGVIDIGNSNRDQASPYNILQYSRVLYGKCAYFVLEHPLDDISFEIVFNITDVLLDKKAIAVNF